MPFDKHYSGQGFAYPCDTVNRVVTVRLSDEDILILNKYFPDKSISFAIRSCIHGFDKMYQDKM